MNQVQRNYLIDQIKRTAKIKRDILRAGLEDPPSLNMYI